MLVWCWPDLFKGKRCRCGCDVAACGACGMGCDSDALHLEPVSEEEWFQVASSFTEWEEKHLAYLAAQNK